MTDASQPPRRAAVLGHPIGHSLSPVLHRGAYEALGLASWTYEKYEVTEAQLPGFLEDCDSSWAGLSLTMPLKQSVLNLLDMVEPLAKTVGAVNTVLFSAGGLTVGANTDVYGIVQAIHSAQEPAYPAPRRAVVIGGGATAASAIAAVGELGIVDPIVLVRSKARAGAVVRAATAMGVQAQLRTLDSPDAARAVHGSDIVISTIPGAASAQQVPLVPATLDRHQILLDVVYEGWPAPLARAWQTAGGVAVPGTEMLLHQAVEQVRLMTSVRPEVGPMRAALTNALGSSKDPATAGE